MIGIFYPLGVLISPQSLRWCLLVGLGWAGSSLQLLGPLPRLYDLNVRMGRVGSWIIQIKRIIICFLYL
jgi:hypothetical protein